MQRGLIVKGRRYYAPKFDEYVTAVEKHRRFVSFRRANGSVVKLMPKNVFYVSCDDYNLCSDLADSAKMSWFFPGFDETSGTEVNYEEGDLRNKRSFRIAIRDLSEGLIDVNFEDMENPRESDRRFRAIVLGMGFEDPGNYLTMLQNRKTEETLNERQ